MLNNFHRSQFEQLRIKIIAIYFCKSNLIFSFLICKKNHLILTFSWTLCPLNKAFFFKLVVLFYHCQVWTDYLIWYQLFNVGKLDKILTEYKYQWKLKHAGNTNYALIILKFNSLILTWLIILGKKITHLVLSTKKKKTIDFLNDNYIVLGHDSSEMIETIQNSNMTCIF